MGTWSATLQFKAHEDAQAFAEAARNLGAHVTVVLEGPGYNVTLLATSEIVSRMLNDSRGGVVTRQGPWTA